MDLQQMAFMAGSYLVILVILYYINYELGLASDDPKAFTKNLMTYIIFIIIPVVAVFALMTVLAYSSVVTAYVIFGGIVVAGLFAAGAYFLQSSLSKYIFNKYLLYVVVAAIFLVGLSILATLFSGTLRKLTGWTGFVINLLFYIPCLLRDAIHGAIQEYQTFSSTLVILFVLEVVFLMMYFFLIPFVKTKMFPPSIQLINEPVMLNTSLPLKTPSDLSGNYSISMWVYLNPGPKSKPGYAVETPIFSFLDASGNRHVQVSYSNLEQGNNDHILYVGDQSFPMTLPLQKWNNIVFNCTTYDEPLPTSSPAPTTEPPSFWSNLLEYFYKSPAPTGSPPPTLKKTTVDIFVNGYLERSFTYDREYPVYSSADTLFTGNSPFMTSTIKKSRSGVNGTNGKSSNKEGLYGAICNVVYYREPLTKIALTYNFNFLTIHNPPIL
jgi:hypothetical protein